MRDCVLKMPETHPLQRWLKGVAEADAPDKKDQEVRAILTEVLTSQFNLITDLKTKGRIVGVLTDMPEDDLGERLLKSYLYLVIGNVTRSDNLLKEFINRPPYENWKGAAGEKSIYHQVAREYLSQVLGRLSRHPSDRSVYQLFAKYILTYFREEQLLRRVTENQGPEIDNKLSLKFMERLAPSLVRHLRLASMSEERRIVELRDLKKYPLKEQAYWHWPFFNVDPLIAEHMMPELRRLEKEDELWFIYLMENERLSDLYFKEGGKTFLPKRRKYLRQSLDQNGKFMLALFKLIEFGDIDDSIVTETVQYLNHE